MEPLVLLWLLASFLISFLMAARGIRKKSLSPSGAAAATAVGTLTFFAGLRFGATLVGFYLSSSALTRFRSQEKRKLEADFKEGGQRNWIQVLSSSITATALLIFPLLSPLPCCPSALQLTNQNEDPFFCRFLIGAFISHYACCNGDTWASEIGILSRNQPRLVLNLKPVPKGTNGGISPLGLMASAAGGGFVGLIFLLFSSLSPSPPSCPPFPSLLSLVISEAAVLPLGILAGTVGSLIDSLLGATLQYSGYCSKQQKVVYRPGPSVKHICGLHVLSNEGVNFFSALLSTIIVGYLYALT